MMNYKNIEGSANIHSILQPHFYQAYRNLHKHIAIKAKDLKSIEATLEKDIETGIDNILRNKIDTLHPHSIERLLASTFLSDPIKFGNSRLGSDLVDCLRDRNSAIGIFIKIGYGFFMIVGGVVIPFSLLGLVLIKSFFIDHRIFGPENFTTLFSTLSDAQKTDFIITAGVLAFISLLISVAFVKYSVERISILHIDSSLVIMLNDHIYKNLYEQYQEYHKYNLQSLSKLMKEYFDLTSRLREDNKEAITREWEELKQKMDNVKLSVSDQGILYQDIEMLEARMSHFLRNPIDDSDITILKLEASKDNVLYQPPYRDRNGVFQLSEFDNTTVQDHMMEAGRIGRETQAKRFKHWALKTIGATERAKKYAYFSRDEDKTGKIYKYDKPPARSQELRLQHVSHACELIQWNNINILTDPVFGDLAPILYPAHTKTGLEEKEMPPIDVIVISHSHIWTPGLSQEQY